MASLLEIKKEFKVVKFDIEDVYEAIKKNGLNHLRQSWIMVDKNSKPIGACVLGQAAINLNVVPSENEDAYDFKLRKLFEKYRGEDHTSWENPARILNVFANLSGRYSLISQLNRFSVGKRNPRFHDESSKVGDTIVYWNDAIKLDDGGFGVYYLVETYEELVEIAYDLLKPHFGKKVKLLTLVYDD